MKKRKNAYSRFEDPLPYPLEDSPKSGIEIYKIPDADKGRVLREMYPFEECPDLLDERLDIHAGRKFLVQEYLALRIRDMNYLVSPFYFEGGGTVIDWVKVSDEAGL